MFLSYLQTIESDFYATEAGRAHFSDQLTSIRYCVQETCNFVRDSLRLEPYHGRLSHHRETHLSTHIHTTHTRA